MCGLVYVLVSVMHLLVCVCVVAVSYVVIEDGEVLNSALMINVLDYQFSGVNLL